MLKKSTSAVRYNGRWRNIIGHSLICIANARRCDERFALPLLWQTVMPTNARGERSNA